MTGAWYNENDPFAAGWLRNLIAAGHLPAGTVDERSILDIEPGDLAGYEQCHFFAGIGGWPYALALAGWEWPAWTGSCPCQPLSSAGQRKGHADSRHLWPAFHRLIAECRPATVFGEQVASKDGREWLAGIRADLEHLGYAVGAADLPAAGVGAPHIRQRLFWVAESDGAGRRELRLQPLGRNGAWYAGTSEQPVAGGVADAGSGSVRGSFQHRGNAGTPRADEGETQKRQRFWPDVGADGSGGDGGLADAEHALGRAQQQPGNHVIDRHDARRAQAHRQPGACGEVRRMGDAEGARSQGEWDQRSEAAGWLDRRQSGLSGNAWSDAVWLSCLDGKARRVEPGIFPLAHGVPNRVGRLRGYGNAIVPQPAAAFVTAFMECRP